MFDWMFLHLIVNMRLYHMVLVDNNSVLEGQAHLRDRKTLCMVEVAIVEAYKTDMIICSLLVFMDDCFM